MIHSNLSLAAALVAALAAAPDDGGALAPGEAVRWDAGAARHLLNRAGFGATPKDVEAAVERGREATVQALFAGAERKREPYFARRIYPREEAREIAGSMMRERLPDTGRRMDRATLRDNVAEEIARLRVEDHIQLRDYAAWWLEGMVRGEDPLRDRMTLFWHDHFACSMETVRNSFEMIQQHAFLRENALGSFRTLLHGIARDPAMLEYLDGDQNVKEYPNENFARELMELFTLGEGNFGEGDVKDAARAFTGWTDRGGESYLRRASHDAGAKTILGRTGAFDGHDVIEILLDQPACAEHLARSLLAWLEGVEPAEERVARYAALLRESEWEVAPVLERLLADPAFYSGEVVGARIASPVDYFVGASIRLGVEPPGRLLYDAAHLVGEHVFFPPSVKGWDDGEAWITTSTLMQRGNLAGVLLGRIDLAELFFIDGDGRDESMMDEDMAGGRRRRLLSALHEPGRGLDQRRLGWWPRVNLSARVAGAEAASDEEVVSLLLESLLAVEVGDATRAEVVSSFREMRRRADLSPAAVAEAADGSEMLLREAAHLVLCLPEAQLH